MAVSVNFPNQLVIDSCSPVMEGYALAGKGLGVLVISCSI